MRDEQQASLRLRYGCFKADKEQNKLDKDSLSINQQKQECHLFKILPESIVRRKSKSKPWWSHDDSQRINRKVLTSTAVHRCDLNSTRANRTPWALC